MAEYDPFKWRHYQGEITLLCVRWYLRYALSYRDLEEMIQERGLSLVVLQKISWSIKGLIRASTYAAIMKRFDTNLT